MDEPGKDDTILHNIGKLITFDGKGPVSGEEMDRPLVIENAAVLIKDGKVTGTGPGDRIWAEADLKEDAECIDCCGRCVVPGFVDPHTHAVFSGTREFELGLKLKGASYLDILKAGGGILRTMNDTRKASRERLIEEMDSRLDIMMRYGTTTAEVKSGYGLDEESEIKLLEAVRDSKHPVTRVPTFLGPHAVPPEYRGKEDEFVDLMIGVMRKVNDRGLARFSDIFCEVGVFDLEQSRRFLKGSKDHGMEIKIHSDEIENLGGTRMGAELGAVSADHLLVSNDGDLEAMLKAKTVPVLLPGTLMTIFEERVPRARDMIEMGLPVALATDINPNCMVPSLQFIQAVSCYRLRMTPNEVLAATTINASAAVGMVGKKGAIAPGFDADILVLKDASFDHVVYNFGVNHVDRVLIGGRTVLDGIGW